MATSKPGERNDTLYRAALKCGSYIAGAGMDMDTATDALQLAAIDCGLTDEDGEWSVLATIRSAFRTGFTNARAVRDHVPASDKGNAMQLATQYGGTIRFVPEIGKWMHWNGVTGTSTPTPGPSTPQPGRSRRPARNHQGRRTPQGSRCRRDHRDGAARPFRPGDAGQSGPPGRQRLRTQHPDRDRGPSHRRDRRSQPRRVAHQDHRRGVRPRRRCPSWKAFLDTTFEGDQELIAYIQGLCGYAAIGEVLAHILPFFWGAGHNGKTVLLETI